MSKWAKSMKERHKHSNKSERHTYPLRKIVLIVADGNGDIFGSGDKVLLECGHEVYSHGIYKARCRECKLNSEQNPERSVATEDKSGNKS